MTPEQIISASNAKIARLEHKVHRLEGTLGNCTSALNNASSLFEAQTKARYEAMRKVEMLLAQVRFLENFIAFISDKNAAATEAARAHFEKLLAAANWSTSQWSYQAGYYSEVTRDLQEKLASKSKEDSASEKELQEMLDKYTAMEATVLQKEIEKENAERDLKETERLLLEAQEATEDLKNKSEKVNSNLASQNRILDAQKRRQSKEAKEARARATKEHEKYEQQLEKTKEMIRESEKLEKQLRQKADVQKDLRRKCDTILKEAKATQQSRDYYKSKDAKQSKIIQSLKDQILNLESAERTSAFTKAVNDLNMEVDDLKSMQAKLQKDLEDEKRVNELSLSKAKEQAKTIEETEKKLAQAKGASLEGIELFLKTQRCEKLAAGKYIADQVFGLLKDLNELKKAKIAYSTIVTFLGLQLDKIAAAVNAEYEVTLLIKDLRDRFQREDLTALIAMDDIEYVSGLQGILKKQLDEEKQTETEQA